MSIGLPLRRIPGRRSLPDEAGRSDRAVPKRTGLTAFVLSGGGNQGVSQVGMLRALVERGIVPDLLVGTSAGAFNAAAMAHDPTMDGVDLLTDVWLGLRGDEIFPGSRLGRAWHAIVPGGPLYRNTGLASMVDRFIGPGATFGDLQVPLRVIATDLHAGHEVVLLSGPLKPALLASSALPGIFPSVEIDGRMLVDGGVVDNVPVSHALVPPVAHVYVLNVSGGSNTRPPRWAHDILLRSFAISRNVRFELETASRPEGIDLVVLPRPIDERAISDFSGAARLIDDSYRLAVDALDALPQPEPTVVRRRRFRRAA